jgi:energy-coupling factor transport system substrate-specific component
MDQVVTELLTLRAAAGHPSYAEIARRVQCLREGRGVPFEEARVARTTVYDAFRFGRRRIDEDLVVDVARALGADDATLGEWSARCRRARAAAEAARQAGAPTGRSPASLPAVASVAMPTGAGVLVLATVCVLVNLVGAALVYGLKLPLFLDTAGTALAAIVLGPWWGAGVGLSTNLGMAAWQGPQALPFALVNVLGGLIWGYGVRRLRMGVGLPRFFALNLAVGVACTVVAAPIVYLVFDGGTGNGSDHVTRQITAMSHHLWLAVTSANLVTSLVDKLLSGFFALVAIESFPLLLARGRDHLRLVRSDPR